MTVTVDVCVPALDCYLYSYYSFYIVARQRDQNVGHINDCRLVTFFGLDEIVPQAKGYYCYHCYLAETQQVFFLSATSCNFGIFFLDVECCYTWPL